MNLGPGGVCALGPLSIDKTRKYLRDLIEGLEYRKRMSTANGINFQNKKTKQRNETTKQSRANSAFPESFAQGHQAGESFAG